MSSVCLLPFGLWFLLTGGLLVLLIFIRQTIVKGSNKRKAVVKSYLIPLLIPLYFIEVFLTFLVAVQSFGYLVPFTRLCIYGPPVLFLISLVPFFMALNHIEKKL
jgi:hypothetical protein